MRSVDERIVDLQFKNKQFEDGVQTSLKSLDNLKKGLDDAGDGNALYALQSGVEAISGKFSALGIIGVTALQNITNSALDAGKRIASSFTIDPVMAGFSEYETQINAVQTILANTQGSQKKVSQETIDAINETAFESLKQTKAANEASLDNLKDAHKKQLKEHKKLAGDAVEILEDRYEQESEVLKKAIDDENNSLKKAHKEKLALYNEEYMAKLKAADEGRYSKIKAIDDEIASIKGLTKAEEEALEKNEQNRKLQELQIKANISEREMLADEMVEIVEEQYDKEYIALEKALNDERDSLNKAHKEKLALYDEEYMAKLKTIDEERYNKVKAIEDQIELINGLTKAENEALEIAKQNKKLQELQNDVYNAKDSTERTRAEKRLAEYQDEVSRKRLLKERENRINTLKDSKDAINAEYKLVEEKIKNEYEEKKKQEKEIYDIKANSIELAEYEAELVRKQLLEERDNRLEVLEICKDAVNEEYKLIEEQIKNEYDEKKKQENEFYEIKLASLKDEQAEKKKLLKESYETEKEYLQEQQEAEEDSLRERHSAEISSLKEYNDTALENIEIRKKAELKALTEISDASIKATTLDDVNRALDELNEYADKTIYNFTEMTRNIGTFTAAGVDLDTSVQAIKGIANLAAVSGSTSQQASTAMYQLSQALASGTVKLQDWVSVRNAGMGGQVFQDALKETARVHGIAIDEMIMEEGSFHETLHDGWLTAEVLTETLAKFTGDLNDEQLRSMGYTEDQIENIIKMGQMANDAATKVKTFTQLFDTLKEAAQSGWTQSWEIVIGDFEEAKELFTEMSDIFGGIIGASADSRNEVLFGGLASGWKQLLAEGIDDSEGYKEVVIDVAKEHGIAVDEMIESAGSFEKSLKDGWLTADILSESLTKLTDKTIGLSDEELKALGYTRKQVEALESLDTSVKEGSISLDEFADKMTKASGRENLIVALKNTFEGLSSVIKPIKEAFAEIFPPATADHLYNITEAIRSFSEKLTISDETSDKLRRTFAGLFAAVDIVISAFKFFFGVLGEVLGVLSPVGGGFLDVTASIGDFFVALKDDGGVTDLFKTALENISVLLDWISEKVGISIDIVRTYFEQFSGIDLGPLKIFSGEVEAQFKPFTLLAEFIKAGFDELKKGFEILSPYLTNFIDFIKELGLDGVLDLVNSGLFAALILGIKKFVDSLAEVTSGAKGALDNITRILDGVRGSLEAYQQTLKAKALLTIATAIGILAASLLVLSMIDSEKLTIALIAITTLFAELAGTMVVLNKSIGGTDDMVKVAGQMIAMSAAIFILSIAMKSLAELDIDVLLKGGFALTALSAILVASSLKLSKSSSELIKGSAGLIAFSAAILILTWSVKALGGLDVESLAKGLIGVGAIMAGLVVFTQEVKSSEELMNTSLAMAVMGAALFIIAKAVQSFGNMSWEEIARGLIALGGSLLIITLAINAMSETETLTGVMAMLAMAGAIMVLAPALMMLGAMDLVSIGVALLALIGVFAVVGVSGSLLAPLAPVILTLAGAIALLGVGVFAIGVGLLAFAAGLTALAAAGAAGVAALVAIVSAILSLIPMVLEKLAEGIIAFCGVISKGMPAIMEAVAAILTGLIQVLVDLAPRVIEALFVFLKLILQTLVDHVPSMVDAGLKLFIGILEGIAANIQDIVVLALKIIAEFLRGLAEGLPEIIDAAIDIVLAFLNAIGEQTTRIVDAAFKMIIDFINGLANAIRENTPLLVKAMVNLASAIIEGLINGIFAGVGGVVNAIVNVAKKLWEGFKNFFGIKSPSKLMAREGENVTKGLQEGVKRGESGAVAAIKNLGKAMMDGITGAVSGIGAVAANVIDGLKGGITGGLGKIGEAAQDLGDKLLDGVKGALGIESPSKRMAEVGEYSGIGLVQGLNSMKGKVSESAGAIGDTAAVTMKKSLSKVSDALLGDFDMSPTIRPVVDMSQVEKGLDTAFSKEQSLNVGEIKGRAATVAASHAHQNGIPSTAGDTMNDNSEQQVDIHVTNIVRNDNDIQKINRGLDNIITKYKRTKGVPVTQW